MINYKKQGLYKWRAPPLLLVVNWSPPWSATGNHTEVTVVLWTDVLLGTKQKTLLGGRNDLYLFTSLLGSVRASSRLWDRHLDHCDMWPERLVIIQRSLTETLQHPQDVTWAKEKVYSVSGYSSCKVYIPCGLIKTSKLMHTTHT